MTLRDRCLNVLLWYAVLAWSAWAGGTLYQMLVVVPMWSANPPDSVHQFFQGTTYTETIHHFFGPPFMAARLLPTVTALLLAWHLPRHRAALGLAVACLLAAVLFTLFYIYPINEVLILQAGGDRSATEISRMVQTWIWADRLRFAIGLVALFALLRAFRLPLR